MKRHRHTDTEVLRKLVAEREMSLRDLATGTGLSYSFVREVARGMRQLSDRSAHKIARFLDVDTATFISVVEPPQQDAA